MQTHSDEDTNHDEEIDWDIGEDETDLRSCPNCGEDVYDLADQCPHCGHWIIDEKPGLSWIWIALACALIGALLIGTL